MTVANGALLMLTLFAADGTAVATATAPPVRGPSGTYRYVLSGNVTKGSLYFTLATQQAAS